MLISVHRIAGGGSGGSRKEFQMTDEHEKRALADRIADHIRKVGYTVERKDYASDGAEHGSRHYIIVTHEGHRYEAQVNNRNDGHRFSGYSQGANMTTLARLTEQATMAVRNQTTVSVS